MYPGAFSSELWVELMWSFVWIMMIPVAVTLILLILPVLAEVVSRVMSDRRAKPEFQIVVDHRRSHGGPTF